MLNETDSIVGVVRYSISLFLKPRLLLRVLAQSGQVSDRTESAPASAMKIHAVTNALCIMLDTR